MNRKESTVRKLRPDSNQSDLSADETERLMKACRTMGYREAVVWAKEHLDVETSTGSLCRWYQKQIAESVIQGDVVEIKKRLASIETSMTKVLARITNIEKGTKK